MKTADEAVARLTAQTDAQVRRRPTRSRPASRRACATPRPRRAARANGSRPGIAEAVAAAEANMARLAEQAEASRAAFEQATQPGGRSGRRARCRARAPPAPRSSRAWARRAGRSATSSASASARTSRRRAELLGCRTLEDMRAVQMRFFRGAVDQYAAEAARMMKLGTEIDEPRAGALTRAGAARDGCKVPATLPLSGGFRPRGARRRGASRCRNRPRRPR